MAKFLLLCPRDREFSPALERRIATALTKLAPDHLDAHLSVQTSAGLVAGALNGARAVRRTPGGLLLGAAGVDGDWDRIGARPDGSFAIARWSDDAVELVADVLATRTIWWAVTDQAFIASSSQVAIVSLLGDLQFDEAVVPWMLATGTLGPGGGWDRRIVRVPPDGVVRLDRRAWSISAEADAADFSADLDPKAATLALEAAVAESFDAMALDGAEWRLPLSGGADSRGILQQLLRSGRRPSCVTWGRPEAATRAGTDAAVARRLAVEADLPYEYLVIEPGAVAPDLLVERFLANGEGRIDHLAAYLDGFEIWRTLHERGIELVVRGDEAFGWTAVGDERQARASVGLHLLSDFYSAEERVALGLSDHDVPSELARTAGESVATWRDRLYHQFRTPIMLAALTDLKLAYVELVNPLISRTIIDTVRRMPDALRTEKRAWIAMVQRGQPGGAFARSGALPEMDHFLKGEAFRAYLRREIAAPAFERTFSPAFARHLLERLRPEPAGGNGLRLQRWAKGVAPAWAIRLVKRLRTRRGPRLNGPTLAFRAVMMAKMRERLERAAAELA